MAERMPFTGMAADDMVERLRVHGRLLTGYAMALAQRAGLNAEDAADLFVQSLLANAPPVDSAGESSVLQHWLQLEAAAMETVHGHVILEREGNVWTMLIDVQDDLAWLRLWNASATYWVDWLANHLNRVAARHASQVRVELNGEELHLAFSSK